MKHFIQNNSHIFVELDNIKKHLVISDIHQTETDKRVDELFSLMDKYNVKETQGIFFQGQIFDAYAFFQGFRKEMLCIQYDGLFVYFFDFKRVIILFLGHSLDQGR